MGRWSRLSRKNIIDSSSDMSSDAFSPRGGTHAADTVPTLSPPSPPHDRRKLCQTDSLSIGERGDNQSVCMAGSELCRHHLDKRQNEAGRHSQDLYSSYPHGQRTDDNTVGVHEYGQDAEENPAEGVARPEAVSQDEKEPKRGDLDAAAARTEDQASTCTRDGRNLGLSRSIIRYPVEELRRLRYSPAANKRPESLHILIDRAKVAPSGSNCAAQGFTQRATLNATTSLNHVRPRRSQGSPLPAASDNERGWACGVNARQRRGSGSGRGVLTSFVPNEGTAGEPCTSGDQSSSVSDTGASDIPAAAQLETRVSDQGKENVAPHDSSVCLSSTTSAAQAHNLFDASGSSEHLRFSNHQSSGMGSADSAPFIPRQQREKVGTQGLAEYLCESPALPSLSADAKPMRNLGQAGFNIHHFTSSDTLLDSGPMWAPLELSAQAYPEGNFGLHRMTYADRSVESNCFVRNEEDLWDTPDRNARDIFTLGDIRAAARPGGVQSSAGGVSILPRSSCSGTDGRGHSVETFEPFSNTDAKDFSMENDGRKESSFLKSIFGGVSGRDDRMAGSHMMPQVQKNVYGHNGWPIHGSFVQPSRVSFPRQGHPPVPLTDQKTQRLQQPLTESFPSPGHVEAVSGHTNIGSHPKEVNCADDCPVAKADVSLGSRGPSCSLSPRTRGLLLQLVQKQKLTDEQRASLSHALQQPHFRSVLENVLWQQQQQRQASSQQLRQQQHCRESRTFDMQGIPNALGQNLKVMHSDMRQRPQVPPGLSVPQMRPQTLNSSPQQLQQQALLQLVQQRLNAHGPAAPRDLDTQQQHYNYEGGTSHHMMRTEGQSLNQHRVPSLGIHAPAGSSVSLHAQASEPTSAAQQRQQEQQLHIRQQLASVMKGTSNALFSNAYQCETSRMSQHPASASPVPAQLGTVPDISPSRYQEIARLIQQLQLPTQQGNPHLQQRLQRQLQQQRTAATAQHSQNAPALGTGDRTIRNGHANSSHPQVPMRHPQDVLQNLVSQGIISGQAVANATAQLKSASTGAEGVKATAALQQLALLLRQSQHNATQQTGNVDPRSRALQEETQATFRESIARCGAAGAPAQRPGGNVLADSGMNRITQQSTSGEAPRMGSQHLDLNFLASLPHHQQQQLATYLRDFQQRRAATAGNSISAPGEVRPLPSTTSPAASVSKSFLYQDEGALSAPHTSYLIARGEIGGQQSPSGDHAVGSQMITPDGGVRADDAGCYRQDGPISIGPAPAPRSAANASSSVRSEAEKDPTSREKGRSPALASTAVPSPSLG